MNRRSMRPRNGVYVHTKRFSTQDPRGHIAKVIGTRYSKCILMNKILLVLGDEPQKLEVPATECSPKFHDNALLDDRIAISALESIDVRFTGKPYARPRLPMRRLSDCPCMPQVITLRPLRTDSKNSRTFSSKVSNSKPIEKMWKRTLPRFSRLGVRARTPSYKMTSA